MEDYAPVPNKSQHVRLSIKNEDGLKNVCEQENNLFNNCKENHLVDNHFLSDALSNPLKRNPTLTSKINCQYINDNSNSLKQFSKLINTNRNVNKALNFKQELFILSDNIGYDNKIGLNHYKYEKNNFLNESTIMSMNCLDYKSTTKTQLEDYDDKQANNIISVYNITQSKQRKRTHYTQEQLSNLEELFQKNHYPNSEEKKKLSYRIDIEEAKIHVWFQNRRSRENKMKRFISKKPKLTTIHSDSNLNALSSQEKGQQALFESHHARCQEKRSNFSTSNIKEHLYRDNNFDSKSSDELQNFKEYKNENLSRIYGSLWSNMLGTLPPQTTHYTYQMSGFKSSNINIKPYPSLINNNIYSEHNYKTLNQQPFNKSETCKIDTENFSSNVNNKYDNTQDHNTLWYFSKATDDSSNIDSGVGSEMLYDFNNDNTCYASSCKNNNGAEKDLVDDLSTPNVFSLQMPALKMKQTINIRLPSPPLLPFGSETPLTINSEESMNNLYYTNEGKSPSSNCYDNLDTISTFRPTFYTSSPSYHINRARIDSFSSLNDILQNPLFGVDSKNTNHEDFEISDILQESFFDSPFFVLGDDPLCRGYQSTDFD
ncbi:unnamed protein product [Gordionus sp. m RMFG-2023]|uniref:homeobox protein 2-like n=1 Tax=Gordionus sp. m RMFG-2023 TaxID=3053472 RepID=UPI0030E38A80